ncbi:MAG: NUDIX domain-containing protein [Mycobacterium sp.]
MPDRVIRVSAAVIVDDDGHVLVVRKRGTTAFMQPGGKIDAGETPLIALLRELREELEVVVAAGQAHALGTRTAKAANEPGHVVQAELFLVELADQPHPSAEIAEMTWIDPDAPVAVELAPLTRDVVFPLVRGLHAGTAKPSC